MNLGAKKLCLGVVFTNISIKQYIPYETARYFHNNGHDLFLTVSGNAADG
jgi:hypothetical protein